jgi:primary-amine oxidase
MMNRPVEIMDLHIVPYDFFTANPAIDVPQSKNASSRLVPDQSVARTAEARGSCCNSEQKQKQKQKQKKKPSHARL